MDRDVGYCRDLNESKTFASLIWNCEDYPEHSSRIGDLTLQSKDCNSNKLEEHNTIISNREVRLW
jgi:hypothetical protein